MLRNAFEDRVLPFDSDAAREYAYIAAMRRFIGRIVPLGDGRIAAIAGSHGMSVATRKVRDFEDTGIETVNPWTAA